MEINSSLHDGIPDSVKSFTSIGTPKENIDKFTSLDVAPRNLLDTEDDPRRMEMEQGFINERLEYSKDRAQQNREMWRLSHALTPKDVAPCLDALRILEKWDFKEGVNTYQFQSLIGLAIDNHYAYAKSHKQLIDEGVVVGNIDRNGYIANGGQITEIGIAYVAKIDKIQQEITSKRKKSSFETDPVTGARLEETIKTWEEWETYQTTVEKPCFLSETERYILSTANLELAKQLITGQKQHFETEIFDAQRAALEEQVKIFFFKGIGMSNDQFSWFFNAKDISKITPDNKEGKELGRERNRTMRIQRLIGHCETKEKFEKHLNESFALEKILDEKMIDRTLSRAGEIAIEPGESQEDFFERKFEKAAKYLLGEGLTITKVKRRTREGDEVYVKQYEMKGWLTAAERDVCTDVWRDEDHKKSGKKGGDAVKYETEILKSRGLWTSEGNTFTRGEKDLQFAMNAKISISIGDPKGFIVRDADQMMWTRGEKDEMGAEIYAFKYVKDKKGNLVPELDDRGNMIPNLPTGEELVALWNRCLNEEEWKKEAKPFLKRFSLPGEPIGSDLSKLFHAYLYQLKDHINERPTGLLLGVDKMPRMAQSMLKLGRTKAKTGYISHDGKVVQTESLRSLLEQWDGFKGDDYLVIEPAVDLSDIAWNKVRSPEEVEEIKVTEIREALVADKDGKITKELWKSLKIDDEARKALINKYGDEAQALTAVVGEFFAMDDGGVGDNIDGFYKLFNFLAGDGNPAKRPHAYFTETKIEFKDLLSLDYWTGKKKFLQIIYGAAGAWGDFRKYDRFASKDLNSKKQVGDKEQFSKIASTNMKDGVDRDVSNTQIGWYDTVRSSPMYDAQRSGDLIKYKKYSKKNGKDVMDEPNGLTPIQIIEGKSDTEPGLAVRFGFMKPEKIGKAPEIKMNVLH